MSIKVLLLDESCDINTLLPEIHVCYNMVVCLFWAAPATKEKVEKLTGGKCVSMKEILRDAEQYELKVYAIVRKICEGGPKYEGLPWRFELAGQLYQECEQVIAIASALDILFAVHQQHRFDRVEVDYVLRAQNEIFLKMLYAASGEPTAIVFRVLAGEYHIAALSSGKPSLLKRIIRQFSNALVTGNWYAQLWFVIEKIDSRYEKRCKWNVPRHSVKISAGGATFFSSYLNNSRVLLGYEKAMPFRVRWLVNNYYAYKGVSPDSKTAIEWLWQYSSKLFTLVEDQENISQGKEGVSVEEVFRAWLAKSSIWHTWRKVRLPSMCNLTDCWDRYLELVKPKIIVVANQWGVEGWFTRIARGRGMPVVQVMHGVLGGYFHTKTPIISDSFVVPGEFWKNLWPEDQRGKIIVFNPDGFIKQIRRESSYSKRRLTFFSWPLTQTPFYNFPEFIDGFIRIFQKILSSKNYEICIRAHPLENPSDFVNRWKRLYGALPHGLSIESGKKGSLDDVLRRTDIALMFRSTVMLNCLSNGIPTIMPGWIDFGWRKELLQNVHGLYVARDFKDLEEILIGWLDSPPKIDSDTARFFIRPAGEGESEFRTMVNDLAASELSVRQCFTGTVSG